MSLGVVVKGPEGIVLAADSRVTLDVAGPGLSHPIQVNFDNATKLLSFGEKHNYVGAVTYGQAIVGLRTAHSFMPEFEIHLGEHRKTTVEYARELGRFFLERWREAGMPEQGDIPSMTFVVGGYDPDQPYGNVFLVDVPKNPEPEPRNPGPQDFGMTWGGQLQVASRLIHGSDPALFPLLKEKLGLTDEQLAELLQFLTQRLQYRIPFDILPLQDCIDMASFLVRATVSLQNLGVTIRGVGGVVEIAIITRTRGLRFVQKKRIHGENADEIEYNGHIEGDSR